MRLNRASWLPVVLWPLGFAAVAAGFVFLFQNGGVTALDVVNRSVGGSFIACGLIAWQRRPENRTGVLMTLTGFLFLSEDLLIEIDSSVLYTLGQIVANWWLIPFTILVLGFPNGRITGRVDALIVAGFVLGTGVIQVVWLLFLEFPPGKTNVILVDADAGLADTIDTYQTAFNATVGLALSVVGIRRWLRAAPPLRRLLLPMLAGALAALALVIQTYYFVISGEFTRVSQTVTSFALVGVPLAFLVGLLRAQLARAGMADLVVALQQAPGSRALRDVLARALGDDSVELVFWLPGFERYVDADGRPVTLPEEGGGRSTAYIDHDGQHVAALVHDAALDYQPDLLEVVCAAAYVALERERLEAEVASRVEELAGSRARLVEAGDAARRRLERDLHDGAQQRLVSLAIALRMTEHSLRDDPEAAAKLVAAAREELSQSLEELRELARGIHPAVLEHGLPAALESLAMRSTTPVSLELEPGDRLPAQVELAAYFVVCEALANVGKYADASAVKIRLSRDDGHAVVEVADDGVGGAEAGRGSGLEGLADRVEAVGGHLSVVSPPGAGTVLTARLPCAAPAPSPAA